MILGWYFEKIMSLQSDRQSHHAQAALPILRDLQAAPGMDLFIVAQHDLE